MRLTDRRMHRIAQVVVAEFNRKPNRHASLDAPGTVCALASHGCSKLVSGAGGFDQHHPVPIELGGDPNQPLLALCPLHHRRQHSLIRYLIERLEAGQAPQAAVTSRFRKPERDLATTAVAHWDASGRPPINGWPCPAARAL